MDDRRILVMTGTTDVLRDVHDPDHTDVLMEEVFDLTLPSKQRYAKKHGYDLCSLRSFGNDIHGRFNPDSPFWVGPMRVMRVFEMLQHYDVVMWIDADSVITNDNYTIDDFMSVAGHTFYASYDWYGKSSFSTGNFIVQRTEFLDEFVNTFYGLVRNFAEEQGTLNAMYGGTHLGGTMHILDHKFLGSIPSRDMYGVHWNGRPDIPFPWDETSFLSHIGGIRNQPRLDILNTHFANYL